MSLRVTSLRVTSNMNRFVKFVQFWLIRSDADLREQIESLVKVGI